jgi:hypothetical protein
VKTETGFINLQLLVLGSDIDSLSILILSLILTPGVSGLHCQQFRETCCLQFYKNPFYPSISKCYPTKLFRIIIMNADITNQIMITYPPHVRYITKTWNTMEQCINYLLFKYAYHTVRRKVLCNILIEFGIPTELARFINTC